MTGVLGSAGWLMLKTMEGAVDVAWEGDVNHFVWVFPSDR
jgi:hypothetical protein